MSQKMLAAVYGVDKRTVSYHISKVFKDSELDRKSVVQKYWTTGTDGKKYLKDHYDLRVIIALGFKIVNGAEARLGEKIGEVGGKVEKRSGRRLTACSRKAKPSPARHTDKTTGIYMPSNLRPAVLG